MKNDAQTRLSVLKQTIMQGKSVDSRLYCRLMLQKVSRTFALTIKTLGFPFREPVLIGYLFCRIADTYEDSPCLEPSQKAFLLDNYYALVSADGKDDARMERLKNAFFPNQQESDEVFLAKHLDVVFSACERLPLRARIIIKKTVLEMVSGMKETLMKQSSLQVVGTESQDDLDRYCYYVAGTVGHMLTDLFSEYSPWINRKRYHKLSIDKEAFGAGLQLTNIIKDAVVDLRRSVSYIPRDLAAKYGVDPGQIHLPQFRESARKIMNELMVKAVCNLNFALRYAMLIPKTEPRIRLFCLLPIFLAIRTLLKAAENDALFSSKTQVKISRAEVRQTVRSVFLMCMWDFMMMRQYKLFLNQLEKYLQVTIPLNLKTLRFLPIARA